MPCFCLDSFFDRFCRSFAIWWFETYVLKYSSWAFSWETVRIYDSSITVRANALFMESALLSCKTKSIMHVGTRYAMGLVCQVQKFVVARLLLTDTILRQFVIKKYQLTHIILSGWFGLVWVGIGRCPPGRPLGSGTCATSWWKGSTVWWWGTWCGFRGRSRGGGGSPGTVKCSYLRWW